MPNPLTALLRVPRLVRMTLVAAIALSLAAPAHAAACSGAGTRPGRAHVEQMRHATLCLLNRVRASHGLHQLRLNANLSRAATQHAHDMVARQYFSHGTPGGIDFVDRIKRTGYVHGGRPWLLGENLAWGAGPQGTPRMIVSAWMHSPPHRANILTARFRQIGIGIATGAPQRTGAAADTYATEFGALG